MLDLEPIEERTERERENISNISPKILSYSQRCDLINSIELLCDSTDNLVAEVKRMYETLSEIADYDVDREHGFTDEWNEAASFNICQQKARQAIHGGALK